MQHLKTKIKLVFLPLIFLGAGFIMGYNLLYWLLHIQLRIVPLKEDILQYWMPIGLTFIGVLLFIRPRVHILKLDRDSGKVRVLYYMVAAAVFCIPTIIATNYLDSATGKLTTLNSISEISKKPATKYYKPESYVLFKDKIGVESAISYSGKRNQYFDFDIYIAMPFAAELEDTLESPAAFLSVHYHQQISSDVTDEERRGKWENFWNESFDKFDTTLIKFAYLDRLGNSKDRDRLDDAARKSDLYHPGKAVIILKPVNEPFDKRNGSKLFYIFLSFAIGLLVWLIMVIIPGLHVEKAKNVSSATLSSSKEQIKKAFNLMKPVTGFTVTPVIIILNILVFVVMVFKGIGFLTFYTRDLIPLGAIYEPSIQKGEWWRLITGMFLHGGVIHLVMNMISLYLAGIFLEGVLQTRKFIVGYILSGIVAGLVSLWWHDKPVVVVGASGAIFGLYGMLLALIVFKTFDAALNKFLLILLGFTAGYSLLMGFLSEGIDNSAHIGGLVAGFILGAVFVMSMKKKINWR